jgi:hypothetical protein
MDSDHQSETGHPAADIQETEVFQEWLAERDEILRHKWLESERHGYDIGFERALTGWLLHHRSGWRQSRVTARNLLVADSPGSSRNRFMR